MSPKKGANVRLSILDIPWLGSSSVAAILLAEMVGWERDYGTEWMDY